MHTSLLVAAGGVPGTWVVAIAAIWGERIRSTLLKPKLALEIVNAAGHREAQLVTDPIERIVPARYYRLRVRNRAAFPPAQEVQVLLTRLEFPGPDGQPQAIFDGVLPMMWQHHELYPTVRTIGRSTVAFADLFFVRDGVLQLTPMTVPYGLPSTMQGDAHFWVTLVARGLNGESQAIHIQVDWDGKWDPGEIEMTRHLNVSIR